MTTAVLPSCPYSSTCVTPGISRRTHSEGEYIYIICIYLEYMYLSLPTRRKQPIGPKHELDSARTRPRGGQATHTCRRKNSERYAEPVSVFSFLLVGLHGPGWRHVLGMPPRGCSSIFATLTARACATDLGQGPIFRPDVRVGTLRSLERRARETTRGRKRKKMPMCKKKRFEHNARGLRRGELPHALAPRMPVVFEVL